MNTTSLTRMESITSALLKIAVAAIIVFLVVPILAILPLSFNDSQFLSYPMRGLTLRWYEAVFQSDKWRLALTNSLLIGVPATLIATILGTLAAVGLWMTNFRGKGILTALLLSPLVVPIVIVAIGLYFFFAPLGLSQTYTGLIVAHSALSAPFVVVTVSAALATFDGVLARAAAGLGAPPLTVFRRVMFPLLRPGIISGALFAFAFSFDEVVTVLLLGAPSQRTIPREMYSGLRENLDPSIAAIATMLTVLAIVLLLTIQLLKARGERATQRTAEAET